MIESIDNKKIKYLRKLNQKKYRDKEKLFLIEGIHLVLEAYKSGNLKEVILLENEKIDLDIQITYVTKNVLKSLSNLETPYNIIGVCNFNSNDEIGNKILLLDNIQDPGNLGTIIRSAVAFNVDTIVLSDNTVDLYNSKVLRACQGMNFHINIIRKNLYDEIISLKQKEFKIFGTNVTNGEEIKNVKKEKKYAIIMGNEGNGVSKEIQKICDKNIYINMNKKCESLNVAVATSIILYELSD